MPSAPPTIVEVPVYRYRPMPPECLEPVIVAELEAGATNEALARAYRDVLDRARARAAVLEECRRLNSSP